jgi:hypothetical protein
LGEPAVCVSKTRFTRFVAASRSAPMLLFAAIDPVTSSTSASSSPVTWRRAMALSLTVVVRRSMMLNSVVGTSARPVTWMRLASSCAITGGAAAASM